MAVEFSDVAVFPPVITAVVLTVTPLAPLNNAAPDLVEFPIYNVSVTTVPENVIVEIVVSALLIT